MDEQISLIMKTYLTFAPFKKVLATIKILKIYTDRI